MEAAKSIEVMPNPMNDLSMVLFPLGEWSMVIFDIQGRTVLSEEVSGRRASCGAPTSDRGAMCSGS